MLGISRGRLLALVDGGLLAPIHRATADSLGRWAFDSADIQRLLGALEARCSGGADVPVIGFEAAAEAMRRRDVSLPAFLRMVLDGQVRPVAVDAGQVGLKRLRFAASAVREACRAREAETGRLTVQAAAERMGLKWEVVRHLVRVGLIAAEDGTVPVAALDAFSRTYVAASEAAREAGTSPRALIARLHAGVSSRSPAPGWTAAGRRSSGAKA
ncbi:hypothetical protein [Dankookia sp. P2]|uniref:hypothetical protein n=1 Tax=Dankookia sp. P2 TaxID=3423955 RepID=UPI003D664FDC